MNYMNISINKWIVFAVIIFLLLALTAFAGYCVYDLYQVFSVESEVNGKPDDVSIDVYIPPLLDLRGEGDTLLSSDIDYMYFENDVVEYKKVQRYKDIFISEIDLSKVTYENFDIYKDKKVYITQSDFLIGLFSTVADVIYFEAVEDTRYYAKYEFEPMSYDSAKDYYLKFNDFVIMLESENYYLSGNINFEFTLPNSQNNLLFSLEVNISIFSNKTVVEFAYDTKDYASDNVKFFNNYLVNEGMHIEVLSYDKISDIPLTSHETGTNVEVVEPAPEQPEEPDGGDEVVEPGEPSIPLLTFIEGTFKNGDTCYFIQLNEGDSYKITYTYNSCSIQNSRNVPSYYQSYNEVFDVDMNEDEFYGGDIVNVSISDEVSSTEEFGTFIYTASGWNYIMVSDISFEDLYNYFKIEQI